jgi:tetratricopeptide (TPR) repeat protein
MAHNNYAFYLTALKRHDDALAEIELARELDPVSLVVNSDLGWAYYFARRYDQAIQQFRRALEITAFWPGPVHRPLRLPMAALESFQNLRPD